MIAPIRPQGASDPAELAGARRTVAALFFKPTSRRPRGSAEPVSRKAVWLLAGWATLIAVAYLFRGPR